MVAKQAEIELHALLDRVVQLRLDMHVAEAQGIINHDELEAIVMGLSESKAQIEDVIISRKGLKRCTKR